MNNVSSPGAGEREISLIDLLVVLARHRLAVLGLPLAFACAAVAATLLMRDVYTASASVVPVQQAQSNPAAALIGQLDLGGFGSALNNRTAELFARILQSRKVGEEVVGKFKLVVRYEAKTPAEALAVLAKKIEVDIDNKSGIVKLSVDDWNPAVSADMANYFVDRLKQATREITLSEATQRRVFYEQQLALARTRHRQTEADFKAYQTTTGVFGLDQQAGNTLGLIAKLDAEITAKEIQLRILRTTMTDGNPQVQAVLENIKGLRGRMATLKNTKSDADSSLGQLSAVSTEYSRLLRELKYQESVVDLLTKQYEMAKLDEAKNAPVVQVLDFAVAPEEHSKPKRKLIVLGALFAGGLMGVLYAFMAEAYLQARREPEQAAKLDQIRRHMLAPPWKRARGSSQGEAS
jgi:uncharacterized protein involved in exopolysaccharide biosynthesis